MTKTTRAGDVCRDGVVIGRVQHSARYATKWGAYVVTAWNPAHCRYAGTFATRREAAVEVIVMREV